MVIEFTCDAVCGGFPNSIVKVLLTAHHGQQQEIMLLNILQTNLCFQRGDTVEVTFRVTKHHGDSAMTHHD